MVQHSPLETEGKDALGSDETRDLCILIFQRVLVVSDIFRLISPTKAQRTQRQFVTQAVFPSILRECSKPSHWTAQRDVCMLCVTSQAESEV